MQLILLTWFLTTSFCCQQTRLISPPFQLSVPIFQLYSQFLHSTPYSTFSHLIIHLSGKSNPLSLGPLLRIYSPLIQILMSMCSIVSVCPSCTGSKQGLLAAFEKDNPHSSFALTQLCYPQLPSFSMQLPSSSDVMDVHTNYYCLRSLLLILFGTSY